MKRHLILITLFLLITASLANPKELYYEKIVIATAYSYTGSLTSTGKVPKVGTIAVDPYVIPYGTRLHIPGYGSGVAEDCGGAIVGNKIDLFMTSIDECYAWGVREVKIKIYY